MSCAPPKRCQNQKPFRIPSKRPPNTCIAGWANFFHQNMFSRNTLLTNGQWPCIITKGCLVPIQYSPLCLESLVKESTWKGQLVYGSVEPLYKVSPEKLFGRGGDQIHMRGLLGGQLFTESIITTAQLLLDSTSSSTPPTTFLSEIELDHLAFLRQWEKVPGDGLLLCSTPLIERLISTHQYLHLNRDSLHLAFSILCRATSVGSDFAAAALYLACEVTSVSSATWKTLCQKMNTEVESARSARELILAELNFQVGFFLSAFLPFLHLIARILDHHFIQ